MITEFWDQQKGLRIFMSENCAVINWILAVWDVVNTLTVIGKGGTFFAESQSANGNSFLCSSRCQEKSCRYHSCYLSIFTFSDQQRTEERLTSSEQRGPLFQRPCLVNGLIKSSMLTALSRARERSVEEVLRERAACRCQAIINQILSHLSPPLTNHMINVEIDVDSQLTRFYQPTTIDITSPLPLPPMAVHAGKAPMARCAISFFLLVSMWKLPGPNCFFVFIPIFSYYLFSIVSSDTRLLLTPKLTLPCKLDGY